MTHLKMTGTEFPIGKPEPSSNYWRNFRSKLSWKEAKTELTEATGEKIEGENSNFDVTAKARCPSVDLILSFFLLLHMPCSLL
jgi:hypothetical protein